MQTQCLLSFDSPKLQHQKSFSPPSNANTLSFLEYKAVSFKQNSLQLKLKCGWKKMYKLKLGMKWESVHYLKHKYGSLLDLKIIELRLSNQMLPQTNVSSLLRIQTNSGCCRIWAGWETKQRNYKVTSSCRLCSVHPGVGIQAVLPPQITLRRGVVPDHLKALGQESDGWWVLGPLCLQLTCKK